VGWSSSYTPHSCVSWRYQYFTHPCPKIFPSKSTRDSIVTPSVYNAMTFSFSITVGVLALQGAFSEHIQLLRHAGASLKSSNGFQNVEWSFIEVRTPAELERCDALIIPGGESTTMSLVAQRSGLLEPLRAFVKYDPSILLYRVGKGKS